MVDEEIGSIYFVDVELLERDFAEVFGCLDLRHLFRLGGMETVAAVFV